MAEIGCLGCGDGSGTTYCPNCVRLMDEYANAERRSVFSRQRRTDLGTTHFIADPPLDLFTFRQYCAGFAVLALGLTIWGFGLWSLGRVVLGFLLRHGW